MTKDYPQPETPGQFVQALLAERGWTQEVLASVMGVSVSLVSRIVTDRVAVDAEKALVLHDVFGISAETFLEIQKNYELIQARLRVRPDPQRALRAQLYSGFPIGEMIERGWINAESPKDTERVEQELARFFGVDNASEIPLLSHAAKKTNAGSSVTDAQHAWLHRVRLLAQNQIVGRYSPTAVREAIGELAELRADPMRVQKVPSVLAEAGVRFVVVESLASAKIDGVCFWLNDLAPVVGMTIRYDRIDNFWFVLRHELEHVLRGHGRKSEKVDVELEGEQGESGETVPEEERVANAAAADFCVPQHEMEKFYTRKYPYFIERDLLGFAATVRVHPGLVVGQLQRRSGRYDRFRQYLVKVREHIAKTAVMEGWGHVYAVNVNR